MSSPLGTQYQELKRAFEREPCDLQRCAELLTGLKLALVRANLLIPNEEHSIDDLVVARDILEIGAFCSIRSRDIPSFDRNYSQLQTFYSDYASLLPPSPREYPIIGLNLIRLLTLNRIAEFHTVLESLPSKDLIHENPFIRHPVDLERRLMEGSYSKVWNARDEAPAEEYKFFVDSLMGTIRNEIASCHELAYDILPLQDACTLLFFSKQSDLIQFANQHKWQVKLQEGLIEFSKFGEEKTVIPKKELITSNLNYARELEQIV